MKYEVLIMPTAEAELEAAYQWIYERAPEAAVKWHNDVLDAVVDSGNISGTVSPRP